MSTNCKIIEQEIFLHSPKNHARKPVPHYTCCKALSPLGDTPLHLLQSPVNTC